MRWRDALADGRVDDNRVEPFADRNAAPSRSLTRGFPRLRPDSFDAPRRAGLHARSRISWSAVVAGRFFAIGISLRSGSEPPPRGDLFRLR